MSGRLALAAVLATALLAGCAGWPPGPRNLSGSGERADEQLLFLDRLATASDDELEAVGERLETAVNGDRPSAVDSLQYALWQATPGHPGHDAPAARQRLEGLLIEAPLERELRALIRVQLRHLRARAELVEGNQSLSRENQRLEKQIQALTALEREMGSGDEDNGGDNEDASQP